MFPVCMWQCTCSKRKFEDKTSFCRLHSVSLLLRQYTEQGSVAYQVCCFCQFWQKCAIIVASFPGLPCSFCSLVCVDNNTRMWRSGEEWGRPGIIHHVSGVRWMQGGRRGAGPVVVTAGPEAVHCPVGSVPTFRG